MNGDDWYAAAAAEAAAQDAQIAAMRDAQAAFDALVAVTVQAMCDAQRDLIYRGMFGP